MPDLEAAFSVFTLKVHFPDNESDVSSKCVSFMGLFKEQRWKALRLDFFKQKSGDRGFVVLL